MDNHSTLGLDTPERTAAPEDAFLTSVKGVESWIAGLPMASVGETSQQVFKTLVEFNRLEMPSMSRIKIAELFQQPIGYITDSLRKFYFDTNFPLSAKNRKIAVLNRELYSELAIAYKIYVEETVSGRSGKFDRKLLVISLHRALRALSGVLHQSALIYTPPPEGTWGEINHLFAYAEKHQVHDIPVKESTGNSAIIDVYRQILLFAVCSPYRLRQREIEYIHAQAPAWSETLTLTKARRGERSPALYVVELDADFPPVHSRLREADITPLCRQFDSTELVGLLRDSFNTKPSKKDQPGDLVSTLQTSRQLLRKIIQTLSRTPRRRFVRTQLNLKLHNVVGLSTIHRLLRLEPDPEPEETLPATRGRLEDIDWFEAEEEKKPLINTLLYTSESNADYSLIPMGAPLDEESILATDVRNSVFETGKSGSRSTGQEQPSQPFCFKTENESAGGYCIRWQGKDVPKIQVGEILGIQSATDERQFSIGISRWLRNIPGQGLQVGMELISPHSFAVSVRALDGPQAAKPENCLILPELEVSGQPASLLAPALCFKVGEKLLLQGGEGQQLISLTRLLETAGTFAQYQFVHLETGGADPNRGESGG